MEHLIVLNLSKMPKTDNTQCWQGCDKNCPLIQNWGVCVCVFACWERVGYKLGATFGRLTGVLIIITMQIVFDSAILLLEI